MNCPNCAGNHKRSAGMTCYCGYEFALDPKSAATGGFSDNRIVAAARKAGGDGERVFTANQLWQCSVRSAAALRWSLGLGGVPLVVVGLVTAIVGGRPVGWVVAGFGCLFLLVAALWRSRVEAVPFERALDRFESKHGPLPKRLRDTRPLDTPPPPAIEADVFDYGVLGVLICQRAELVDLLVLNGFAAEQGLLVLAEDGYPGRLLPRLRQVLGEQPELPVFVLHDATAEGEETADRVGRDSVLRVGDREVIDVGLSRADVKRLGLLKGVRGRDGSAPVDAVPWAKLTAGLAAAVAGQTTLAAVAGQGDSGAVTSFG